MKKIQSLFNAGVIAVWNSIHAAWGYFPVKSMLIQCRTLFSEEESIKFSIKFSINRHLLTFIFVVFEVLVLLDKSNKALTLGGHFHLTSPLTMLVPVQIQVSHLFACFIYITPIWICVRKVVAWIIQFGNMSCSVTLP